MVNKRGKCCGVSDIGAAFGCGGPAGGAPPSGGACPGGPVAFHCGAAVAAWSVFGHGTTRSLPYTTGWVQHRVFPVGGADICPPSIYFPCLPRSRVRNDRSGTHFLSFYPVLRPVELFYVGRMSVGVVGLLFEYNLFCLPYFLLAVGSGLCPPDQGPLCKHVVKTDSQW